MLVGSLVSIGTFMDVFYLVKYLKKYREIKNKISSLENAQVYNVSQIIDLVKNTKQTLKGIFYVKGIMKAKIQQQDKNIFSMMLSIPFNHEDPVMEHAYDEIPYHKLMKLAQYQRPQQLKDIKFNLQDMISQNKVVSIEGCEGSSITGALSKIKEFQVPIKTHNLILRFLKYILNLVSNISPFSLFKSYHKTGYHHFYYSLLEDRFAIVAGELKKEDQKVTFYNPRYITKQLSFILKRLKINQLYYKFILNWLIAINILLIFFFVRFVFKQYPYLLKGVRNTEEKGDELQEGQQCIICYVAPRNVVFMPCKHYGMCSQCYLRLQKKTCPMCKTQISSIIPVVKNEQENGENI